jgi:hypothetical protein
MPLVDTTIQLDTPPEDDNGKWLVKFYKVFNRLWQSMSFVLNGNVSFGDGTSTDNIQGVWATALTVIGNFTVTHNLGKIPVGYFIAGSDAFENIKFVSSTTTTITFAGQNGGANIRLFIF